MKSAKSEKNNIRNVMKAIDNQKKRKKKATKSGEEINQK